MKDFVIDKIEELTFTRVEEHESLWQAKVLDSITIVELVVELEKEAGIKIPFQEITEDHFETVALILNYLEKKKAN